MVHYIVDLQGFKRSSNRFVFKEVSVLSLQDDAQPLVFLFKPPFAWEALLEENKSSNHWLEFNYHGLCWEHGDIIYEALQETLKKALIDSHTIFVNGFEKKHWLGEVLPEKKFWIEDVQEYGCPSLRKLPRLENFSCTNHIHIWKNPVCAAENTLRLREFLLGVNRDCVG